MRHRCVVNPTWRIRETARYQGLIKKLDRPRSALAKAVRNADVNGLGSYFEVLLRTWIEEVPPAQLTAANWQVYAGEHTIGEFDLLFERDGRSWHWELALKFYLGHPAPDGQFRWYGPDPKDRLDRKWAKMRGHQLRLHTHPAAQGALGMLDIEGDVAPRAFIKGYLFLPLNNGYDVEFPPDVNPDGLRGWWVHRSELASRRKTLDPQGNRQWLLLDSRRWMSPVHIEDGDRLCSFDALTSVVPAHRPTLVAGVSPAGDEHRELTRGFVVPDTWPHG